MLHLPGLHWLTGITKTPKNYPGACSEKKRIIVRIVKRRSSERSSYNKTTKNSVTFNREVNKTRTKIV